MFLLTLHYRYVVMGQKLGSICKVLSAFRGIEIRVDVEKMLSDFATPNFSTFPYMPQTRFPVILQYIHSYTSW